jgi:hypothetical protein
MDAPAAPAATASAPAYQPVSSAAASNGAGSAADAGEEVDKWYFSIKTVYELASSREELFSFYEYAE